MINERDKLLQEIETFLKAHGMYPSYFGRDAINDTALVSRLRAGGDVRLETVDRIRAFMRNHPKPAKKRKPRPNGSAVRAQQVA